MWELCASQAEILFVTASGSFVQPTRERQVASLNPRVGIFSSEYAHKFYLDVIIRFCAVPVEQRCKPRGSYYMVTMSSLTEMQ